MHYLILKESEMLIEIYLIAWLQFVAVFLILLPINIWLFNKMINLLTAHYARRLRKEGWK